MVSKTAKWKAIVIILFPVQWLLFSVVSSHPHFIENWYSNGLYKVFSLILRALTGWIPFSLGEIIIYLSIIYIIYSLIRNVAKIIKCKTGLLSFLKRASVNLLAFASVTYFLFMVLWGLNYHREPLITVNEESITKDDLKGLCFYLIDKTNNSRKKAGTVKMRKKDIIEGAYEGYRNLKIGEKELSYSLPAVKSILFTNLFSFLGVSGIYNPFTGEANVNADPPRFLLPATVCHEMAHQAGIAPEDEANYVAFIVCKKHSNPFFQYSGYLMAMRYAMTALKRYDRKSFDELWGKINMEVKADLEENRKYWARFRNPFEKYSDKIYDNYLKANNQKAGIESYGLMVRLLLNDYSKGDLK